MKRVLIIAGLLVLSLGALALWLSIEQRPDPLSGTPTGATRERDRQQPTPAHKAKTTRDTNKTASPPTQLTQSDTSEPEKDSGFRPITEIRSDLDTPQGSMAAPLARGSAPGSSREDVLGGDSTKAATAEGTGTPAASPTPGKSPAIERPRPTTESTAKSIEPRETRVTRDSQTTQPSIGERSQLGATQPTSGPAIASGTPAPKKRSQPSRRRQRSPAPAGRYETITMATARSQPDVTGPIVDRIRRGTILNVTGSRGDWLIVYSKTKNITVYVRRDEAMLSRRPPPPATDVPESQWPHVEEAIRQAFVRNNVVGVQATFIGDTAYLKGTVKTDRERERAEIFVRSVLEVKHVFNGVRVE